MQVIEALLVVAGIDSGSGTPDAALVSGTPPMTTMAVRNWSGDAASAHHDSCSVLAFSNSRGRIYLVVHSPEHVNELADEISEAGGILTELSSTVQAFALPGY